MKYNSCNYYLLFLFLFLSNFVKGQDERRKIDSLITILESRELDLNNYDKIETLCHKIETLSTKIDYTSGSFYANRYLVNTYRDSYPEKRDSYLKKMDKLVKFNKLKLSSEDLISYYLLKGHSYGNTDEYLLELNCYLTADSINEMSVNKENSKTIKNYLSNYYFSRGEYKKALTGFQEVLSFAYKSSDTMLYLSTLNNIGSVFLELKQLDSATLYVKKADKMGYLNYFPSYDLYLNLCMIHIEEFEYDSALFLLKKIKTNLNKEDEYSFLSNNIFQLTGVVFQK